MVKKIINFFTGRKTDPAPRPVLAETRAEAPANEAVVQTGGSADVPHLSLWNRLPQAYVQLLLLARMEDIHKFALANLQKHPDYPVIKEKLDAAAIERLLLSDFALPAAFAFSLAQDRYNPANPDVELVKAMLYGKLEEAQQKAREWVEADKDIFLQNPNFVAALLLCPNVLCRNWIADLMSSCHYSEDKAKEIVSKTVTGILSFNENTADLNEAIGDAGSILVKYLSDALKNINLQVAERLIHSKAAAAKMLGVDILFLQKERVEFDRLSGDVLSALIRNEYPPLRAKGMVLLSELSTSELLKRQEIVVQCCTAEYTDVRNLVRPLLQRMAEQDSSFGVHAAEWLLPLLLRKENSEGLHRDVAEILRHELFPYINGVNKELVLRLLYSAFVPTQEFGITLLETSIDPNALTLRQIIALGNHETRSIREWSWRYFENNVARIKYERDDATRLLDASWEDSREFAKAYFRKQFEASDWTPEVLVGLADSVRPDIEAYGRELITRFFRDEQGEEYLIKLSQHPSTAMQLFATAYLERFAADDLSKLQSLEFYFRSVLTRVNKGRVAKNRVFRFLAAEGKKSGAAARFVAGLISQLSATVSVEDKARCIEILLALQDLHGVQTPVTRKPVEERK